MSRERLCPFAERSLQPPQPLSTPFGPGVSALFRLLDHDDSCDDSLYVLHGTLTLAVWLSQALSFPTLSREFPTRALPPTQVTVGLPQMDRVAVSSNLLRDFVSQVAVDPTYHRCVRTANALFPAFQPFFIGHILGGCYDNCRHLITSLSFSFYRLQ